MNSNEPHYSAGDVPQDRAPQRLVTRDTIPGEPGGLTPEEIRRIVLDTLG